MAGTEATSLSPGHPTGDLPADLGRIARRVEERLARLFEHENARWAALDPDLTDPLEALSRLVLSGGKRLRPAFCHWGFRAGGGDHDDPISVDAGAAFELLQGFALIHDDVMDGSSSRRGAPAVHRQFVDRHRSQDWAGEDRRFGEGVAILAGDLAFVYADLLLPDGCPEATALWHELRVELNVGQYLDLVGTAQGRRDRDGTRRIARYKSGKYTIERPLQLGAALAGGHHLADGLSRYGDPLGEAFQLRDDVVGDPGLGPTQVGQIQEVLVETGALAAVEARIDSLAHQAVDSLVELPIDPVVTGALTDLADFVVARNA